MLSFPISKTQRITNAIKDTAKAISAIAPILVLKGEIKPIFGLNRLLINGINFLSLEFASQKQTCSPIRPNQKSKEIIICTGFVLSFNENTIKGIASDERTEKTAEATKSILCSL